MTPDRDRFNDDYDPEPDYDRPSSNREAMADEMLIAERDDAWVEEEYTGRFCPVCGADILGNDPHEADCPVEVAEREAEEAEEAGDA